jgi:hypothetical protein
MRPSALFAIILGIAFAIVFFKVYGLISRPDVPTPVAFVVDNFAPGVAIGQHVADARHSVAAMSYVPHLGFVGLPGSRDRNMPDGQKLGFAQVRLLLDERTRVEPHPDPASARIDAVEVVTAETDAAGQLTNAFVNTFHRPPRDGCIQNADEGQLREVHLWTTPNERGGIAVITDFGGSPEARTAGPVMTSVLAFTGKFDGGRTLRANYRDVTCAQIAESR